MRFLRHWTKSVETTEKSVVAKDLVRCLKNHEFFETPDQIFRANRFCFSVYQKIAVTIRSGCVAIHRYFPPWTGAVSRLRFRKI
jgi:hypothetical protein